MTAPREIPRTNTDLARLASGPTHRGTVETVDLTSVRGWCLDRNSPSTEVLLEVYCEGVRLGTTRTWLLRKELSERLGALCHAGFSYHWKEVAPERIAELIVKLEASDEPASPITLSLLVVNAGLQVDPRWAQKQGLPSRAELLAHLKSEQGQKNKTITALREQQLAALPKPRVEQSARVRALAFYLPAFHRIPENDEWWGPGFTEWTTIPVAKPQFEGHYQPRIPGELGYYDLRTPGVIESQIDLARAHGLAGFCFHHYWFAGKRLLEAPLERFRAIDHDLGFCISWANEPWSRRWDGSESEVLMPQPHTFESDVAFIHDAIALFKDPRYIRVDGKPFLIVYRVGLLSDPPRVFDRWRQICQENGLLGLHVCMAETFGATDPFAHGCDSAVEFPPLGIRVQRMNEAPQAVPKLAPDFTGMIYDYGEVVSNELTAVDPPYPRFKTVMLGWDNTARKGAAAHICSNFSLPLFESWLEDACQRTERLFAPDSRLVFVNAWNEWGEGTYLEPDRRYGRTLLEAVRQVVIGASAGPSTFEVLRQRLAGDDAALSALERIADDVTALRSSLRYALETRQPEKWNHALVALTANPPPAVTPVKKGGSGVIEQLGPNRGSQYCCLTRGSVFSCSGWSSPNDRALTSMSAAFVKLIPTDGGAPYYGQVRNRIRRDDLVRYTGLDRKNIQWSGFSFVCRTAALPAGTYTLAIVFPAVDSEANSAVEFRSACTLEIVE